MPSFVKTIAQELGISTASVSRALNDQPGVGEDLRARILEKAAALDVRQHIGARGLASAQTFTLGFFIRKKPDLSPYSDPFYGEIMHGVEQVVNGSEYHLAVASLDDDMLREPELFRYVRERRIDGMILAGPDIPADFILPMLRSGLPVVLVDNMLEFTQAHAVTSDDEGGAYQAARYLLALGHTQIGMIAGPESWSSNRNRERGYRRALAEAGHPLAVVHMDWTNIETGRAALTRLLADAPGITAIAAVNDSMALGALIAARATGLRVPHDLSIIGFDDLSWAALNDPPLTTMHIPKHQLGAEAAGRLLTLLNSTPQAATHLMLSVTLVERSTCIARG